MNCNAIYRTSLTKIYKTKVMIINPIVRTNNVNLIDLCLIGMSSIYFVSIAPDFRPGIKIHQFLNP